THLIPCFTDTHGSGHVGRRNHDRVRRSFAAGVRPEQTGRYPLLVPSLLYLGRRVLRRQGRIGLAVRGGLHGFGHAASLRWPTETVTLASATSRGVRRRVAADPGRP